MWIPHTIIAKLTPIQHEKLMSPAETEIVHKAAVGHVVLITSWCFWTSNSKARLQSDCRTVGLSNCDSLTRDQSLLGREFSHIGNWLKLTIYVFYILAVLSGASLWCLSYLKILVATNERVPSWRKLCPTCKLLSVSKELNPKCVSPAQILLI